MVLSFLALSCGQPEISNDAGSMAKVSEERADAGAAKVDESLGDEDMVAEAPAVISGAYLACYVKKVEDSHSSMRRVRCEIRGVAGELSPEQIAELYQSLKVEGVVASNVQINYDKAAKEKSYVIAFDVSEGDVEKISGIKVEMSTNDAKKEPKKKETLIDNVANIVSDVPAELIAKPPVKSVEPDKKAGSKDKGDKAAGGGGGNVISISMQNLDSLVHSMNAGKPAKVKKKK